MYLGSNEVRFLYNLTLTPNPNPGGKPPRPPVRSLYYLTLTLTLKIKIRLEHEFGFAKMYLVPNQVRFLYYLTLTPNPTPNTGGKPQTPRTFLVIPNSNPNPLNLNQVIK